MKKLLLIILLSLLSNLSFAEDSIISEDLTKVKISSLTPLTSAQIKEEITNVELYGFHVSGIEFTEKHWDNYNYMYFEKKGSTRGTWKIGKNKICYKMEGKNAFDCVDIYKKIKDGKTYYYFANLESGVFSKATTEHLSKRKVHESKIDIAWKVDDKFIKPECFDYVWSSGDNYETFFDEYIEKLDSNHWKSPAFEKFVLEIGNYLNKEVPLNHSIITGWEGLPEISLTGKLDGCLSDKPETYIYHTKWASNSKSSIGYEVIKSFDLKIGKELAPHINEKFESIKQVRVIEWGGGSMGPQEHVAVYGILKLDGKKVILPLANRSIIEEEPKDEKTEEPKDEKIYELYKFIDSNKNPKIIVQNFDFEKALATEVNDLSIYLGMSKKEIPLVKNLFQVLRNSDGDYDEIAINNKDYFIVSGCRFHSCPEKGILWIDKKNKIVIGAIVHYFLDKKENYNEDGNLLIISKQFNSFEDLPDQFNKDLRNWLSIITYYDYTIRENKQLKPTIINFINSKNEIKQLSQIK